MSDERLYFQQNGTCRIWTPSTIDYQIAVQYWLDHMRAAEFSTDKPYEADTSNSVANLLPGQIEKVV